MARRLIGLDIGTNAVRVVELEPGETPTVTSFGQVALPLDAMREGEVVDRAAVTAAIQRLWKELSLRKGEVRVGVASPRVLVRTVDLPVMSEADLAGALRFQAQELIPIPLEEAVLDFQVLEQLPMPDVGRRRHARRSRCSGSSSPPPTARWSANLVGAVQDAGLTVSAVDLVPLALIRAIGRRVSDNGSGAEAIVSIGGGVTVVVVHEAGLPRFVRVLGLGGRSVTDAIARDLAIPFDQAEALKRQTGQVAGRGRRPRPHARWRVRSAISSSRSAARSTTTAASRARRGCCRSRSPVAGRSCRASPTQLRDLVGLPVEPAAPREQLAIGDIGFPTDRVADLDPYLPTPTGLALGGLASGRRINLVGPEGRAAGDRRRAALIAGAVGALAASSLLGGIWWLRKSALDDEKDQLAQAQAENAALEQEKSSLSAAQQTQTADRDADRPGREPADDRHLVGADAPGDRAHDPERHLAHRVPGHVDAAPARRRRQLPHRVVRDAVDLDAGDPRQHDDDHAARRARPAPTPRPPRPAPPSSVRRGGRGHGVVHRRRSRLPVGLGLAPAHRHPDPVVLGPLGAERDPRAAPRDDVGAAATS